MLGERYRIVGQLGAGGMGEVFRADDLKLGQPVALKFLPEPVERDPVRLNKFIDEVRTARQISHPNVCRVYDVGEVEPSAGSGRVVRFLTMEYVDGEDLRSLLRRIGRFSEDKGTEIARQICAGLAAMHDRGVLHRDLKPANIMIDGRGRVRLTDLGLATAVAGAGTDGEIAGTPAYMAPEQLDGQPLSIATDLYALGLVLFELFTGERLQKTDDVAALRELHRTPGSTNITTTHSAGVKLDPVINRVIERCLERDPAKRPQSAITVSAALPGGDPLAAALAAGETPSPHMVAAAGEAGGLSYKVAVPLLAALIVVLLLSAQPPMFAYTKFVKFPHSPEVLASKAEEMLVRLGYTEPVIDRASGFMVAGNGYQEWLKKRDQGANRWQGLSGMKTPLLRFWYRTSPDIMAPTAFFGDAAGSGMPVREEDPPRIVPGMTYLQMDTAGHLLYLDVEPPIGVGDRPASPPDWPALFREAGLDLSAFTVTAPQWVSRSASDANAAWVGPGADDTGAELRVEAAAFRGRPVFFRLRGPWQPVPTGVTVSPTVQISGWEWLPLALIMAIPAGALILAVRNLRLGRTDTRGATRLSIAVGGICLAASALGTDFKATVPELPIALVSWAVFVGLVSWTFYAAVEPYVRRSWPQMLISWSRLIEGRWRDPLVGRDLLAGSAIGALIGLSEKGITALSHWRGRLPPLEYGSYGTWPGLHLEAARILGVPPRAIWIALAIIVMLVVLRLLLRSERAAAVMAFVLLAAAFSTAIGDVEASIAIGAATMGAAAFVFVATRFGFVMFATAFITMGLVAGNSDFSEPAFARAGVWLGLAAAGALGLFGFFTATRGRNSAWLDS